MSKFCAIPKPKAYDSTKERTEGRGGEREEIPSPTEVLWEPLSPDAYLQSALALTSPTLVLLKKFRTASVYRLSDNKSLIDVLLGLALACLTL